jgi:CheY-like chemotaxis protein
MRCKAFRQPEHRCPEFSGESDAQQAVNGRRAELLMACAHILAVSPRTAVLDMPMARVLIVDDNKDFAQTLVTLLEAAGHEVCAVYDGYAGLTEAQRQLPDAVVLDINLPRIDGVEVARRLREQYGGDVKLIACTGYGDDASRQRIARGGFDVILTKPARVDAICAAVTTDVPDIRTSLGAHAGGSRGG